MLWELRYERDGFSVESAKKKKRKLPDWYLEQPPDVWGSEFFYDAYRDLVSCRHPDGPIPWTAAMEYAGRKGLAPDLANAVWIVVNRLDSAERGWRLEQQKAESEGG